MEQRIEGVVTVAYQVTDEGEIENPTVIKGLCPSCDAEAVRLVKMLKYGKADEDFDSVKKLFKRKGYNWTLLDVKGDKSVVDRYKVKVYPSYFLIDTDGTLCMSPALSPSENFEARFKQMFQKRQH